MTKGHAGPPDVKSSASGVDDTRHVDLSLEVAHIMSRDDDDARRRCRREGYQSATSQQGQCNGASIRPSGAERALVGCEKKKAASGASLLHDLQS
jgi:hypothetical protein